MVHAKSGLSLSPGCVRDTIPGSSRSLLGSRMSYRSISYWFDSLGAEPKPRPPLSGDIDVDVAIVGGGFTGLWTAYYLMRADPSRLC